MDVDDDEAFLYGDGDAATTAQTASASTSQLDQSGQVATSEQQDGANEDEEEEEEEESDDDLEIILDGEGVAPPAAQRRPQTLARAPSLPQKPAGVPQPTTDYAPLERPRAIPVLGSTTSATPQPETSLPPAQIDQNSEAPQAFVTEGGTPIPSLESPGKPSSVNLLVPKGSLVSLEIAPDPTPTFDVNAVHKDADGNDLFDVDLDAIEPKPWRRPGANLSDYFNYGMNEATWKNYVRKQREMRESESAERNPFISFASGNIQEAWNELSQENKALLVATIMGFPPGALPSSGPNPAQMAQMAAQMGMGPGAGMMPGGGMMGGMMQNAMGGHPMNHMQQLQLQQQMQMQQQMQQQQQAMMGMNGIGNQQMNSPIPVSMHSGPHPSSEFNGGATPSVAGGEEEFGEDATQNGDENGTPSLAGGEEAIESGDIAGFESGIPVGPTAAGRGRGVTGTGVGVGAVRGGRGGAQVAATGRGGFAVGRGRGGIAIPVGPAAVVGALPTGPRAVVASLPANVPTGPRAAVSNPVVPTGPASSTAIPTGPAASRGRNSAAASYRDKDKDRYGDGSGSMEGLDYGGGGGGSGGDSPARSRKRGGRAEDSDDEYSRDGTRKSRRSKEERDRERREREREKDREYERERERERERDREAKKKGVSDFFPPDNDGTPPPVGLKIRGATKRTSTSNAAGDEEDREREGSVASSSRRSTRKYRDEDDSRASRRSSRRDDDVEGDGRRSRPASRSPEPRKTRRTQWSDDEDFGGGTSPHEDRRKRKAEDSPEGDRTRRRSSRRG
ncbi:uncharacterized protein JCM6883_005305 [Sporobolomyces salmoneus]|uniref:uncharacterized protein n=1 Tax=Sporobolomyces salmoneus TaxID=183962 RepID=UPI00316B9237